MQHPIGEHALLADSRTAALIAPDGDVAWLCWPRIDSTPLLFSILDDERGGRLSGRPSHGGARVVSRRCHPRSLVLETVWESNGARLIVDDALDLGEHPLLVRRLRAAGGDVDITVDFRSPAWNGDTAALSLAGDVLEVGGGGRVTASAPGTWRGVSEGALCDFRLQDGEAATVVLGAAGVGSPAGSVDATISTWHNRLPMQAAKHLNLASSSNDESAVRELLEVSAAMLIGLRNVSGG